MPKYQTNTRLPALLPKMMIGVLASTALHAAPLSVDAEKQKDLSITLYNQNLGLVRDVRSLPPINQGQTLYIRDVSHQIMSQTLQVENAGKILEQNLNNNLISVYALLNAYTGKTVQLARFNSVTGNETVADVLLLSSDGNQALIEQQGQIETVPVNQQGWRFIFPSIPEGMQARPSLEIRSAGTPKASDAVLTYLTSGLSWQMDYALVLNTQGDQLKLDGLATLNNNTGVDFQNSKVLLMAGQVNQSPAPMLRQKTAMLMAESMADSGAPQAFQDYQLYKLPQRASLLNGQTKQVSLISADKVTANKTYHYQFQVYPSLNRETLDQKPDITISFRNGEKEGLGFPLPAGTARVFSPDTEGLKHFIGSAAIPNSSKGQTINLPIGKAFDLTIRQQQTLFEKHDNSILSGYDLKLSNSSHQPKEIEISANFHQDWKVTESSHPYTRVNASQLRWTISLPADSTSHLQFKTELKSLLKKN
ncbi:hypothetical protein SAMN03080615_03523 [Amphritea atlantica]|jgi:hypothetical protein|uniref:DUF4139 domain-containing protein n=1 Tax=Amphritea atlantica TaxID=355243 RepID=A0A1H9KJ77_9GAMM|nr:DUF4139 domain-containing protein [Amphritea atlantica]SEQ98965.1 hypothetical protein SAMN03080615_03523 [Amphritea atlantica]